MRFCGCGTIGDGDRLQSAMQNMHNYFAIIVVNILIDIHLFGYTQRACVYKMAVLLISCLSGTDLGR